jgi:SAM-dependent methyltransferase
VSLLDFQYFTDSDTLPKRIDLHDVQCAACHAMYRNPVFTDYGFEVLAAEAGCSYGASAGRAAEEVTWLRGRGLLSPGTCVLDVGCYDGDFLATLPAGLRRVGVDIDQPAIDRGNAKHAGQGIQLIFGDFTRFSVATDPDVITMFHVLEHLPDPLAALANLRRQSGPNTRLVVEVPILDCALTNDVNGFFSALHMTHFSKNSLTNCLRQSGWSVVEYFQQPDYNGLRVLAVAANTEDRIVDGMNDMSLLDAYLTHWRSAVASVNQRLAAIDDAQRVAVWGAGLHTEFLYHLTELFKSPTREFFLVDSDPMKQTKSWRGLPISLPSQLSEVDWTSAWLLVSSYGGQAEIAKFAVGLGVPEPRIVRLYDYVAIH